MKPSSAHLKPRDGTSSTRMAPPKNTRRKGGWGGVWRILRGPSRCGTLPLGRTKPTTGVNCGQDAACRGTGQDTAPSSARTHCWWSMGCWVGHSGGADTNGKTNLVQLNMWTVDNDSGPSRAVRRGCTFPPILASKAMNGRATWLMWDGAAPPLLLRQVSVRHLPQEDEGPDPEEESFWGWEEGQMSQAESAPPAGEEADTPPATQPTTPVKSQPPSPAPLWDIEIGTPVQVSKRARRPTPGIDAPWSAVHPGRASTADRTPSTCATAATLYHTQRPAPHIPSPPCRPKRPYNCWHRWSWWQWRARKPPPPQSQLFDLVTGGPLGRVRADLSLHGFDGVMQHGRVALFHSLNVACCV